MVIDVREQCDQDPDFVLERHHVEAWEKEHGPLPDGAWLVVRSGWETRAGTPEFTNVQDDGAHTPGVSSACAAWLAADTPVRGGAVETVGTDAGLAGSFDVPMPCPSVLLGAGKYGLTQLRNLDAVPPVGATLVIAPLPIVGGSGSPARAFALVDADAGV